MKISSTNTVFLCYTALLLFITAAGILTISCDSFVEVDLPGSQLTSTDVFEDYTTASAALTSIYANIRDKGILSGQSYGISSTLGNYTDEMDFYGSVNDPRKYFYTNALLPANTTLAEYWSSAYHHIYAANAVIEASGASASLTQEQKNQLRGEALFIRALLHFYLTGLYGDIPYITGTDYKKNSVAGKISSPAVYTQIVLDLDQAIPLLGNAYSSDERTRPNAFTAKALLARVYLYQGNWPAAANTASALINATDLFGLEQNPDLVFLKDSRETIWQFKPALPGKNTEEGAGYIFFTSPPPAGALTPGLVNSFASEDLRKTSWIGAVSDGVSNWYFPYKYKEFAFTASSREYSIVFRLSEQYLIRSEARAQQGDLIGAGEDLNLIRKRAGLDDALAVTKQQLLDAIAQERRWELFSEFGHRFFDLKRTGNIDTILSGVKPGWNSSDQLFPIPQTELNLNDHLLPQNNGY